MLVTYITIEDISSGLFRTQVIDLLKVISTKQSVEFEVIVLNVPWKYRQHKRKLTEYRSELSSYPITIRYYPFLPPIRYCTKSVIYLKVAILWLSSILKVTTNKRTDLFHCRSYLATYCTHLISAQPIMFDMRSLWVLENISAGNLVADSLVTKHWVHIERQCLERSVYSTAVSKWMVDYSISKVPSANIQLIPIGVDTSKFFYNIQSRKHLRDKLGLANELVAVYSGSLGLSGVNIAALVWLINQMVATQVKFKIVFISNELKQRIVDILSRTELDQNSVIVISPEQHEINNWLSIGDLGIHSLPKQLDSGSRLGTKVVEYWANGMPVIVNDSVGDAVRYIQKSHIGLVVKDENSLPALKNFLKLSDHRKIYESECRLVAGENFDMKLIADKYLQCYISAASLDSRQSLDAV